MSTFYCKKLISTIVIVAMVVVVLILPLGNSTVHAAGTPWVRFDTSIDEDLSKATFSVIKFKSENITATSAAVSVKSNNSAVKVYNTIVEPGKTTGFTGYVVVQGITANKKGANLNISIPGDASITGDIVSKNVNGNISYLNVKSNTAATSLNHIYLQRGRTTSLSTYAMSDSTWRGDDPLYSNEYSVPSTKVKWKTSNKNIATVSKKGIVKVNKKATYGKCAIITATYSGASARYRVYVQKKSAKVTKLSYIGDRIKTMPVMATWLLYCDAAFSNGGAKVKVTWSSSNENVLTVDSRGMVTAKDVGIARVTAKAGNKKLTYTVNVLSIPDFVELRNNHFQDQHYNEVGDYNNDVDDSYDED